jgi:hypothetical protein
MLPQDAEILIATVAKPLWDALIAETPEVVTEEEMTFADFCDEIRLQIIA